MARVRSPSPSNASTPLPAPEPKYFPLVFDATMEEVEVFGQIMAAGRFATVNAVMRVALWRLAQQLDVECPGGTFQLYVQQGKKAETS